MEAEDEGKLAAPISESKSKIAKLNEAAPAEQEARVLTWENMFDESENDGTLFKGFAEGFAERIRFSYREEIGDIDTGDGCPINVERGSTLKKEPMDDNEGSKDKDAKGILKTEESSVPVDIESEVRMEIPEETSTPVDDIDGEVLMEIPEEFNFDEPLDLSLSRNAFRPIIKKFGWF